jgi:hypothetical protein
MVAIFELARKNWKSCTPNARKLFTTRQKISGEDVVGLRRVMRQTMRDQGHPKKIPRLLH